MNEKIKSFFASHTITAHSVVGLFLLGELLFNAVPQFHDLVMNLYGVFPPFAKQLIITALAVYAWYRNNKAQWDGITERRTP